MNGTEITHGLTEFVSRALKTTLFRNRKMQQKLIGYDAPLSRTVASSIGMPLVAAGGKDWYFSRAGLPHSLARELEVTTAGGDQRETLQMAASRLVRSLDPRSPERPPPEAHFKRSLEVDADTARNPADTIALSAVARRIAHSDGPVRLPDAVQLYGSTRHKLLCMVREHHYSSLVTPLYNGRRQLQLIRDYQEGAPSDGLPLSL